MSVISILPVVGSALQKILDRIPDPGAKVKAEAEFQREILFALVEESRDQRGINREEARHDSLFVAGWRPAIGWVCALALGFQYLVRPFWEWSLSVWQPGFPVPPTLDGMLWELVLGMLGIGGLRTVEKLKTTRAGG